MIVYVDDEEPLSYHATQQMPTTIDMTEMTVAEAREKGAVPCSRCFSNQNCTDYPFAYKEGGVLS